MARSSVRTISVVKQLGQQRHPSLSEMESERLFCMSSAVKAQIFPEGCPYCLRQFLTAQSAGAGKRRRQTFFPRRQNRRLLFEHSFPAGGLEARIPAGFSPSTPVGKAGIPRQKRQRHAPAAAPSSAGRSGSSFSVDGIFQREPCQIVIHGLMSVTAHEANSFFDRSSPNHLCTETDHAVHVKIGLTVRTHRQKLRFESDSRRRSGPEDLIDGAPLAGAVSRSFHISR